MSSPVTDGLVRGVTQAFVLIATVLASLALIGVVVFAVALGLGAGLASTSSSMSGAAVDGYVHELGARESRNKLLSIRVEGVILGVPPRDRSAVFFMPEGFTYGYDVQHQLDEAAKKNDVKGILLHLQTPGGTIFGSRAIDEGVRRYQEKTKKPVVAYIEGLSASGGVMAMVGATRIYADHGSLIGSIGVLGPQLLFYNKPVATDGGLLGSGIVTQEGIEHTIISAGRGKDLGNPFRRATDEEIATLTRGVEAEYDAFVEHVATRRKIEPSTIRDRMGAMVFDNATAQQYGLIDGTASRDEAIARLADLAKVPKDFQVVRPQEGEAGMLRRLLTSTFGGEAPSAGAPMQALRTEVCSSVRMALAYYGDPAALCR